MPVMNDRASREKPFARLRLSLEIVFVVGGLAMLILGEPGSALVSWSWVPVTIALWSATASRTRRGTNIDR